MSYTDLVNGALASVRFDLIVFNFALFDEDLLPLLRAVRARLAPQGRILIQTLSPAMLDPYEDGWRSEDFRSMSVPFEGTMPWFGRTYESWREVLASAGFTVLREIEPRAAGAVKPASLILVARKSD